MQLKAAVLPESKTDGEKRREDAGGGEYQKCEQEKDCHHGGWHVDLLSRQGPAGHRGVAPLLGSTHWTRISCAIVRREKAERPSLSVTRYRGGITSYLEVTTAQTVALSDELTAVNILARRMTPSVSLIKAIRGGCNVSQIPCI